MSDADRAHDILITVGTANATVLAFALGIALFVFQTATRYSIPGLRLRHPMLRYLYVFGFALLTVVAPIAASPWPSGPSVTGALGATVLFYATLPLFVTWVGRDALPDTVIRTSMHSVQRRRRAKSYPRRLTRARQAVAAVHAATLAGDIRADAEIALWQIVNLALRAQRPRRLDEPVESVSGRSLEATVSDVLDYLADRAIDGGAQTVAAFRAQLSKV